MRRGRATPGSSQRPLHTRGLALEPRTPPRHARWMCIISSLKESRPSHRGSERVSVLSKLTQQGQVFKQKKTSSGTFFWLPVRGRLSATRSHPFPWAKAKTHPSPSREYGPTGSSDLLFQEPYVCLCHHIPDGGLCWRAWSAPLGADSHPRVWTQWDMPPSPQWLGVLPSACSGCPGPESQL